MARNGLRYIINSARLPRVYQIICYVPFLQPMETENGKQHPTKLIISIHISDMLYVIHSEFQIQKENSSSVLDLYTQRLKKLVFTQIQGI